jgi:hypothetical protein
MPVSGNATMTFAMVLAGLAVLSVGAYSFGKTR